MIPLLPEYVSRGADARPTDIAVVMGSRELSYSELDSSSNRLANWLRDAGCERGDRVCLLVPKGPEAIVGILGTLKAGCAYVPLDVDAPVARTQKMIRAAEPSMIIAGVSESALVTEIRGSAGVVETTRLAWIDDVPTLESIQGEGDAWRSYPADAPAAIGGVEDMAYIMFTSGSTGTPKGVVITHANVAHFIEWAVRRFRIERADRASGHPPLHFDLSVFDLFGTFAAGAELHLVPPERNLAPQSLLDFISQSRLTQWFSVPSTLTFLARNADMEEGDFSSLRRVLWCGDVLPTPSLLDWMDRMSHVEFTNLYGPTETTIASSWFTIPARPTSENTSTPIGSPCEGEEMLVLDDAFRRVPVGEIGDLYVGGVGLSPGYWRDEEKTAEAFRAHPFSADPDARIYRTGDLASVGGDGLFRFHGRNDSQVKSRGYRIELGEIELAVSALGLVSECAVVGAATEGFEGTAICCAYVPRRDEDVPPRRMRRALRASLPTYMLPSRWKSFDALPKNSNGKIDRRFLRELFEEEGP